MLYLCSQTPAGPVILETLAKFQIGEFNRTKMTQAGLDLGRL